MIVGEILHNHGKIRQLPIEVAVSHGAAVDKAVKAVEDVLRANSRALRDPAPFIGVARLGDAGIAIAVNPWVVRPSASAA